MKKTSSNWNFFVLLLTGFVILSLFQWSLFQRSLHIRKRAKQYGLPEPDLHFFYGREKVEKWEARIYAQRLLETRARLILTEAKEKELDISKWKRPYSSKELEKWKAIVDSHGVSKSLLLELQHRAKIKKIDMEKVAFPIDDKHAGLWSMALDNLETVAVRPAKNEKALFLMMRTEVTQGLYRVITGENPSSDPKCGPTCPIDQLSWTEAVLFANLLSTSMALLPCYQDSPPRLLTDCTGWRLPTEKEWKFAALDEQSNMDLVAWHLGNSPRQLQPVRDLQPNQRGIFDLYGNVSEWIWSTEESKIHLGGSVKHIVNQLQENFVVSKPKKEEFIGFRLLKNPPQ